MKFIQFKMKPFSAISHFDFLIKGKKDGWNVPE